MNLWQPLAQHLATGHSVVLVLVKEAKGSVPRGVGAGLVVLQDGSFHGTIGGGALEWEALRLAVSFSVQSKGFEQRKIPLGPNLGQCCGGSVTLTFELWSADRLPEAKILAKAEMSGEFHTKSWKEAEQVCREVRPLDFDETFGQRRIPVAVFGAGHVGKALVLALALAPTRVSWIDSRAEIFPPIMPDSISKHAPARPSDLLADMDRETAIIILTHSHSQDLEIVDSALKNGFSFVGVIGSQTKRARFESLLKKSGMSEELATSFQCPIGIDGIFGKDPGIIAASVTAQILREKSAVLEN